MFNKNRIIFSFLLILIVCVLPVWGQPNVDEIIAKANQAAYYAGEDGRAHVKMTLYSADGSTRERSFVLLRKNSGGGDQKFYVYFEEPADVRKMAYLVWKNKNDDDDRWMWLPALNLKKRIAPGDKRTSFVGSDFVYEDVSGRGLSEDVHSLMEETEQYYVIESTPKNPDSVEFSRYRIWIDKTNNLPVKSVYWNRQGMEYRRVEALAIETIDGFPTVVQAQASDLISGTRTLNQFSNVSYNIGLKERIFTERFLRRPPREVTR